jgi:hypothetical protein
VTPLERHALLDAVPTEAGPGIILALVLAFVLGLVVTAAHRWSNPARPASPSLQASLALLPVVSAMVLLVIGDSLARAFSLVGALAIVRFRTRLRTTWDITFVFLSLAAGIGCGTGKPLIAALGVLVSVLAVAVLSLLPGTSHPKTAPLRIQCDASALDVRQTELERILTEHCSEATLLTTRSLRFGELISLTWRVHLRQDNAGAALVAALSHVEGVERAMAAADTEPSDGGE